MRNPSKEEKDALLSQLCQRFECANIVLVFGDHEQGKMDLIMTHAKEVDGINFGMNAMGTIQNMMHKLDPKIPQAEV